MWLKAHPSRWFFILKDLQTLEAKLHHSRRRTPSCYCNQKEIFDIKSLFSQKQAKHDNIHLHIRYFRPRLQATNLSRGKDGKRPSPAIPLFKEQSTPGTFS